VGIPQALLYYSYYPAWKVFLEELGAKVLTSPKTSGNLLEESIKSAVDEACLPIKLFYGHVLALKDQVDYLFIPRMVSIEKKAYICPKFLGLPDMIKHGIEDLPPIIDTVIDLRKSSLQLWTAAYEIGKTLGAQPGKIFLAYRKALKKLQSYESWLEKGYSPEEALEILEKGTFPEKIEEAELTILLLGHPYNIYDPYLSMNMLEKLKKMRVKVLTAEMIEQKVLEGYWRKKAKNIFWSFGRKSWGAADYCLEEQRADGIIYLAAFGCGPDSFLGELIERRVRKKEELPFMLLNLDEHGGEAGIITRLEAFVEMIKWRAAQ